MADTNKVEYGLSEIHVGEYEEAANGVVTLGSPYKLPGAVAMNLDPQTEKSTFRADNVDYWINYQDNGFDGSLEMARFDDEFKIRFLGYERLDDGGIAAIKGKEKPKVYICFQGEGDKQQRRCILYNVAFGGIKIEKGTTENTTEPKTQSVDMSVVGDNASGITMAEYTPDAAGYSTLFTNPPAPALPAGHEFVEVEPEGDENPHDEGWYTRHGSSPNYRYWLTDDEEVDEGTTYYKYQ